MQIKSSDQPSHRMRHHVDMPGVCVFLRITNILCQLVGVIKEARARRTGQELAPHIHDPVFWFFTDGISLPAVTVTAKQILIVRGPHIRTAPQPMYEYKWFWV